ncbi:glycosyl hydrolases family 31-domain-containing protein [Kalaharituber pfeilii]|nr:glycosyl hydrolases family 31-domain-containing protein [Kalaharituber pfeilii]
MRLARNVFLVAAVAASTLLLRVAANPFSIFARDGKGIDELCAGYSAQNVHYTWDGVEAELVLIGKGCGLYGKDIEKLKLVAKHEDRSRLHVTITDAKSHRYEVPESVFPRPKPSSVSSKKSDLEFRVSNTPSFSFTVVRKSNNEILFSSDSYSLVFQDQYIRLKTALPLSANIYGLGEHSDGLRLPTNGTRTMWSRDSYPRGTHGVFMLNSNGMDIKFNDTTVTTLEYNMLGGIIDLYFFAGPSAEDVAKQYAVVAGIPAMVPYWGLGFHQCRYGYQDWIQVAEVIANYSIAKIPLQTMWTDIDYMYKRWVFTVDPERFPIDRVRQIVDLLHERGQNYIMMVDPAIAYQDYPSFNRAVEDDVLMRERDGSIYKGVVWPGVTAFPDWFHPNIDKYWTGEFQRFFDPGEGVDIDGVWIDMNEPANFCKYPCPSPEQVAEEEGMPPVPPPVRDPPRPIPGFPDTYPDYDGSSVARRDAQPFMGVGLSRGLQLAPRADVPRPTTPLFHSASENLLDPPYSIKNDAPNLSYRTAHTNLIHANGLSEYDTHNLYGTMMSLTTRTAMLSRRPTKRPFIITRSTFAGAGHSVGKWLGDNLSTWEQYRFQVAGMLNFAAFYQMPLVGSDVCGFGDNATEELCARWATLGAFNPFYRNHNELGKRDHEFYLWASVTAAARNAIGTRFRLLDYMYTNFARQSASGAPKVLKPLWFTFPTDDKTWGLDLQFLFGDNVLVSPVTEQGTTSVTAYFPPEAIWYDFYTHEKLQKSGWVKLTGIETTDIPVHIRGGAILPLRLAVDQSTGDIAMTTEELRTRDFELVVALGKDGKAYGELYVDDGVSLVQENGGITDLEFIYDGKGLKVKGTVSKLPGRFLGGNHKQWYRRNIREKNKNEKMKCDFCGSNTRPSDLLTELLTSV